MSADAQTNQPVEQDAVGISGISAVNAPRSLESSKVPMSTAGNEMIQDARTFFLSVPILCRVRLCRPDGIQCPNCLRIVYPTDREFSQGGNL